MNTRCGTHDDLGPILEQQYKDALGEWHENPTHANLTAVTNAAEPLDNITLARLRVELVNELAGK